MEQRKKRKVRLRFTLRRLVSGLFPGRFLSNRKGLRGYEMEELRAFRLGDDSRGLHRKASIKRDKPVVSLKEIEKAAAFLFLVDRSKSGKFGTSGSTKEDLQTSLLTLLASPAAQDGNQVGFLVFTDRVEEYWPPRSGLRRTLQRLKQVSSYRVVGSLTDLNPVFEYLNRLNLSTSVVIVLSDFIASQNFEDSLEVASGRHDIIPIILEDHRERELPRIRGFVSLRDIETGKLKYVDLNRGLPRNDCVLEVFKTLNLDWLAITTDETAEERIRKIANFFGKRRKKRKRGQCQRKW